MTKQKMWYLVGGGIVALLAILLFTGVLQAGWYSLFEPRNCNDTPYDKDCTCSEGQEKISGHWANLATFHCEESAQLLIDPDSPTFESDAVEFVQEYLSTYCGATCEDLSCGNLCAGPFPTYPDDSCISAIFGYAQNGARVVNVECTRVTEWGSNNLPKSSVNPWRMEFYVESATDTPIVDEFLKQSNYCVSPDMTKSCMYPDLPLNVVPGNYLGSVFGPSIG